MATAGKTSTVTVETYELTNCKSFSVDDGTTLNDVMNFGTTYKTRLAGLSDLSASLECDYDASDSGFAALQTGLTNNSDVTVQVLFDGANGIEVEMQVESISYSSDPDGLVTASVSLQANGEVSVV